jgi:hypothetical protein
LLGIHGFVSFEFVVPAKKWRSIDW